MSNYHDDIRNYDYHHQSPFNPDSGANYEEPRCHQCEEYIDECKCEELID